MPDTYRARALCGLDELVEQHKDSLNELPPVADLQALFESLGVGDDSRVVLYGDGGGVLAARAYFTLDYLGHGDRTSLLDGGLEKWKLGSETDFSGRARGPFAPHFTPHVRPEILISSAAMQRLSRDVTSKASLDVRAARCPPGEEFDGTVNSEAVPKAGHIAGAQSLYWKKLIRSETDARAAGSRRTAKPICARRRCAGTNRRDLLPHRNAVVVHLLRRQVSGLSRGDVRRLGL